MNSGNEQTPVGVNDNLTVVDHKSLLRRLRRQAAQHAGAGRVREALDCQRQVTDLAPHDPYEFMQLGFLHRQADELDHATIAFEQARKLAPAEPDPYEALAEIYLDTARYEDAVRESRAVLRMVPTSLPARHILSAAYFQMGLVDKALDITQEMVRLAPLDPISHYKNGMLLQQRGNWRSAMSEFSLAMKIAPEESIEQREAEAAIEALDRQQMSILFTLAQDDRLFQVRLARNAAEASRERGFYLSSEANVYVQHLAIEQVESPEITYSTLSSRPLMYN